jgi:hypothetical protein
MAMEYGVPQTLNRISKQGIVIEFMTARWRFLTLSSTRDPDNSNGYWQSSPEKR